MFSKLTKVQGFQFIKQVHAMNQPSLVYGAFSDSLWRYDAMKTSLEHIDDVAKLKDMEDQANQNLIAWKKNASPPPRVVEVMHGDTLNTTKEVTKRGIVYAVLNFANSQFPGGAWNSGSAQEESMFLRSTCPWSFLDKNLVRFDEQDKNFEYTQAAKGLLNATESMTPNELKTLSQIRELPIEKANKVLLFNDTPRVCFRAGLIKVKSNEHGFFQGEVVVPDFSYAILPRNELFPFYEIRSAAPQLTIGSYHKFSSAQSEQYEMELRRRIEGQLDTLIVNGIRHVVLGAWGCGAFNNNPVLVAKIYCEEITKRAHCFEHIIFPILNEKMNTKNFDIFGSQLDGMVLGKPMEPVPNKNINI